MTAEALSAAGADGSPQSATDDESPRPVTDSDGAPALAGPRQSVPDVVAARLVQVEAPDGAGPNGAYPAGKRAGTAAGARADGTAAGARAGGTAAGARAEGTAGGAHLDRRAAGARGGGTAAGTRADRTAPAGVQPGQDRPEVAAEVEAVLEPTGGAGRFAATAVLDVLRASGWADADEAQRLRAEADRLRELLDLVVRDHRARQASAAGLESQQHHWLIPLLRAAHGVAFGSLGAKVALRTAVQDVPERILSLAGLHIDYGVEHAGDADDER
jgi:hypothetical protein